MFVSGKRSFVLSEFREVRHDTVCDLKISYLVIKINMFEVGKTVVDFIWIVAKQYTFL